ncbi:MAG: hypothetical protein P8I58_02220 [Flavobacteriaceae bacterium]|jgi:hypothetical protein|nr:hypothetical protein [Flavobacteriaceae bacterium]
MELKQVHKYLDLYFEGQTTLEQEAILMDYFAQPVVDAKLAQFKPYFEAIADERSQTYKGKLPVKPNSKTNWRKAIAIAAVAIFGFFMTQVNNTQVIQPSPEEIVFEEFKAHMYFVSQKLNKGHEGLAHIETFNQTTNKFIKTD